MCSYFILCPTFLFCCNEELSATTLVQFHPCFSITNPSTNMLHPSLSTKCDICWPSWGSGAEEATHFHGGVTQHVQWWTTWVQMDRWVKLAIASPCSTLRWRLCNKSAAASSPLSARVLYCFAHHSKQIWAPLSPNWQPLHVQYMKHS